MPWSRETIYSIAADALSFSILARVYLEGVRSVTAAQLPLWDSFECLLKGKSLRRAPIGCVQIGARFWNAITDFRLLSLERSQTKLLREELFYWMYFV